MKCTFNVAPTLSVGSHQCLLLALSRLFERAAARPLSGAKQTFRATTQIMPIYEYTPYLLEALRPRSAGDDGGRPAC